MQKIDNWVAEFAASLFRRAYFLTSHRETAEDLVQETFLAAMQQMDKFEGKSSPKTWLFSILHHKTADYFGKKFQQPTTLTNDFFTPDGDWKTEHRPQLDWQDSPENLLDDEQFQKVLQKCLDDLPTAWRGAFLLKFLDGKKGTEICQDLNLTQTNYWQILHRAKLQLRFCLEHYWFKK
ncbi:MAG: sigma-70 family RNA polymerase sigma factor [Saprospiraceae bacterium]|nr:sigma-70 family RNA polymerase sigma factor [Saprospiraceae bacterium]